MPFRRRFSAKRSGTRKRAIWCNIPFQMSFTEVTGNQVLLVPEDWEASFTGLSNEKAVLRTIQGQIHWVQTANGTIGSDVFWGIYMATTAIATAQIPVFTVSGMSEVDWLHVGSFGVATTASSTNAPTKLQQQDISVKAKRKLDSTRSIYICGQIGTDVASPGFTLGGILRFLVARD